MLGGLGIINFHMSNQALLLKWWDKLFSANQRPWKALISCYYYYKTSPSAPVTYLNQKMFAILEEYIYCIQALVLFHQSNCRKWVSDILLGRSLGN